MTTIACNATEMACDLQGTLQGVQTLKLHTKIWKFPPNAIYGDGEFIVGMAGSADEMIEMVDFLANPEGWKNPPRIRHTSGLVVTAKKQIFYFANPVKWIAVKEKHYAIGSGGPVALGALHAGASPKEAILAATKVDPMTGMGVKVLKF